MNKIGCFLFVSFKIELVVKGGIEPFPEPIAGYGAADGGICCRIGGHGSVAFGKISGKSLSADL